MPAISTFSLFILALLFSLPQSHAALSAANCRKLLTSRMTPALQGAISSTDNTPFTAYFLLNLNVPDVDMPPASNWILNDIWEGDTVAFEAHARWEDQRHIINSALLAAEAAGMRAKPDMRYPLPISPRPLIHYDTAFIRVTGTPDQMRTLIFDPPRPSRQNGYMSFRFLWGGLSMSKSIAKRYGSLPRTDDPHPPALPVFGPPGARRVR